MTKIDNQTNLKELKELPFVTSCHLDMWSYINDYFKTETMKDWLVGYVATQYDVRYKSGSIEGQWKEVEAFFIESQVQPYDAMQFARQVILEYEFLYMPNSIHDWIDAKDDRLCRFILQRLIKANLAGEFNHFKLISGISHFEFIEMIVRSWRIDTKAKEYRLSEVCLDWQNIYFETRHFDWISKSDTAQIKWAINYLQSKELYKPVIRPKNRKESYYSVVEVLDICLIQGDHKLISSMKFAWNKKLSREREQVAKITLNKEYIDKLKLLNSRYQTTNKKTIEAIIDNALKS